MNNFSNPILEFALVMQKKLDKNVHKTHYSTCNYEYLLRRAREEIKELKEAIKENKSINAVINECADVANFMMMIADNYEQEIK